MPPTKVPLPIFFTQSNDESALPDMIGARLVNGYVDKIGDMPFIRKAPGLEIEGLAVPSNSSPNLQIGLTATAVGHGVFTYPINGVPYFKDANWTGVAPGDDVIVATKFGAVAFDIDEAGTVTAVEATGQVAAEFTTAALAVAALPACDATKYRMGWITATKSDGAFTFGTTALSAANSTVVYTNNPAVPGAVAPFSVDGQFWWDDVSLAVTVCGGRFYTQATPNAALAEITGDALTVTGVPVTIATNGWALFAASGGRIVTWHLYGSPITTPTIAAGTSDTTKVKIGAFTYKIHGVTYSTVLTETEPGNDIIPAAHYGAVAFDIDYAGAITAVEAGDNATGYHNYLDAFNGIADCATDKCRIVKVSCYKAGGFTFGTTNIADADEFRYEVSPLYSAEKTKFLADTDAPTAVTHVDYIDGYILANEVDTGLFWYSDADTVSNWGALSFASAEGSPDDLMALRVANKEVVLFGKRSIEIYYDDGVSPFSPIMGAFQERGTIAPYSIVNAAGTWIFLDNERRVVSLENRNFQLLSGPYDNIIRDIDKVSDAYACYFVLGLHAFYALSFPSVKQTFVLNFTTQTWSEWGDWDAPIFELWKGKSYCYATEWEMHLIGDNATGKVYKIRGDYFKQGADNIRTMIRTGHFSSGTFEPKIEEELILRLKRGVGNADVEEPMMTYRYRDEDMVWSNEKMISLGKVGDNNMFKRLFRQGVYRTRQREFVHSDPSDFVFSDMEARILLVAGMSAGGK